MIHEHRFSPEQKDLEIYGKYNVGLLMFKNDQRGMTVLKWWKDKCNEWCYGRLEKDRYGDQMYLNQFQTKFSKGNCTTTYWSWSWPMESDSI